MYLELSVDLTRFSLGQDLNVTRDLTGKRMKERKRKECVTIERWRVTPVGTHLDAALVFSYSFACQNLNVTRHL